MKIYRIRTKTISSSDSVSFLKRWLILKIIFGVSDLEKSESRKIMWNLKSIILFGKQLVKVSNAYYFLLRRYTKLKLFMIILSIAKNL